MHTREGKRGEIETESHSRSSREDGSRSAQFKFHLWFGGVLADDYP